MLKTETQASLSLLLSDDAKKDKYIMTLPNGETQSMVLRREEIPNIRVETVKSDSDNKTLLSFEHTTKTIKQKIQFNVKDPSQYIESHKKVSDIVKSKYITRSFWYGSLATLCLLFLIAFLFPPSKTGNNRLVPTQQQALESVPSAENWTP